ncbi:helix-turn-helix transcriptional regulator [Priestia aryabhattai]|uniref:helix-turn-helix domain-containing protein n=1 Tax=Priestia aryabhattai TaxID=412384 RepID=UPI003D2E08B8
MKTEIVYKKTKGVDSMKVSFSNSIENVEWSRMKEIYHSVGWTNHRVGITKSNLSILKTEKAKAIRFTTLEAICVVLDCQPGDILEYVPDE